MMMSSKRQSRNRMSTLILGFILLTMVLASAQTNLRRQQQKQQQPQQKRQSRQLQNGNFASNLDGRWKSTKLSQKQKAAMGLYPPPGEQWPDDPPGLAGEKPEEEGGGGEGNGQPGGGEGGGEEGQPEEEGEPDEEEGTTAIVDTEEEEEAEVEELKEATAPPEEGVQDDLVEGDKPGDEPPQNQYRRGTFLRYESSKWEKGWAENIGELVGRQAICRTLMHGKHQTADTHTFMELICQARLEGKLSNWCYYHDHNHYMWYNSANRDMFEIYVDTKPLMLDGIDPPPLEVVDYSNERFEGIASKMYYKDYDTGEEYVEYIEPLVAQLKFPLTECMPHPKPLLADFASFVLPPPGIAPGRRTLMYDIGSADWSRLEYIVEEWKVRGAVFEYIVSYAMNGDEVDDTFLTTIPEQHQSHVLRNYFELVDDQNKVTSPSKVHVPVQIRQEAQNFDYVLLKLDRAPASLKEAYVRYILDNNIHVDELIWEINSSGNYVMQNWMDTNLKFDEISSLSMEEAYGLLLEMRKRGIRAHSWI